VTGWPDNTSAEALVAWTWTTDDDALSLVVVNLTGDAADGVVHVGHAAAAGSRWRLDDLLEGASYERNGDDLADAGLYVARAAWRAHVFTARPMPAGANLTTLQPKDRGHDVNS
jgi:hypothetical protein